MFKLLILTLAVSLAVSNSAATNGSGFQGKGERQQSQLEIIKSVAEQKSDGSYFFAYEGADGSYREEIGILKRSQTVHNDDRDSESESESESETELEISGVYRYTDSNGERVEVTYVADKNGFVPVGSNIPKDITETARNAVRSLQVRASNTH